MALMIIHSVYNNNRVSFHLNPEVLQITATNLGLEFKGA